jgi:arabinose-5-phosphate isomerase
MNHILERAQTFIEVEQEAVGNLTQILDHRFEQAIDMLLKCEGRVITTGMGKAGLISRKISATLSSTGTPSCFVHPGESIHGDLGMITGQDVVVALSYKGQTEEVLRMLSYIKHVKAGLIAITSNPDSELAAQADCGLIIPIRREACPLNLAPTASTTAMLALGDTLALTLLEARGFSEQDYAILHPGGSLGRRLLTKVEGLMHTGSGNPIVQSGTLLTNAILTMTSTRMASTSVVDDQGRLIGFFTDGDLRRRLAEGHHDLNIPIDQVMTVSPKHVQPSMMAVKALEILREHKIIELPVCNQDMIPVGLIHLHDITRVGIT